VHFVDEACPWPVRPASTSHIQIEWRGSSDARNNAQRSVPRERRIENAALCITSEHARCLVHMCVRGFQIVFGLYFRKAHLRVKSNQVDWFVNSNSMQLNENSLRVLNMSK